MILQAGRNIPRRPADHDPHRTRSQIQMPFGLLKTDAACHCAAHHGSYQHDPIAANLYDNSYYELTVQSNLQIFQDLKRVENPGGQHHLLAGTPHVPLAVHRGRSGIAKERAETTACHWQRGSLESPRSKVSTETKKHQRRTRSTNAVHEGCRAVLRPLHASPRSGCSRSWRKIIRTTKNNNTTRVTALARP